MLAVVEQKLVSKLCKVALWRKVRKLWFDFLSIWRQLLHRSILLDHADWFWGKWDKEIVDNINLWFLNFQRGWWVYVWWYVLMIFLQDVQITWNRHYFHFVLLTLIHFWWVLLQINFIRCIIHLQMLVLYFICSFVQLFWICDQRNSLQGLY